MKYYLAGLFLLATLAAFSQKGKLFPVVKGATLDDKTVSLPFKNGKYTLVAIAYHRGAEDDLKKWLNPLYENFIRRSEKGTINFDMAEVYDINFVFIPLIAGFKRVSEDFKNGTDKEFWGYILDTEKTDVKELQKQLGVEDIKVPYFYILDMEGRVVEAESGKFTEAKLEKLENAIQ